MAECIEVVMRREADGMWFAETPFLGLTGVLGHRGWNPFHNTPWTALSSMLRAWDWWRKTQEERDRIQGVTPEQRARWNRENKRRWDEIAGE